MWIILLNLAALIAVLWYGLRVKPAPFPPYRQRTPDAPETVPLPDNLPPVVARHFKATIGEEVPVINTAVISGGGKLRFMGITFNSRWRFTHEAGRNYRHYLEATWYGFPVLKVNERYLDGKSRLELPFGIIGQGAKTDSAANLGLWGEMVWLPSVLVTDPRVRWEGIDSVSARLIVPFGDQTDSITLIFDPISGLLRQIEALRWRDEKSAEKIRWINQIQGWKTFHGLKLPSPTAIIWQDQGFAWFTPEVEDVVYNVDVSTYIRGQGL
jgi:Family of unknown function (DUF6544)